MNSIKGSLNVITGCGSGLGKATLQWFLKHGSGPILGIDRSFPDNYEDQLELSVEQKKKICLRRHETFDEEVQNSLEEFVNCHGGIDNLINIAGVALAFTLHSDNGKTYRLDHAHDLVKFNTLGTFNMIRLASRFMVNSKIAEESIHRSKCIVNTSCISTTKPSTGQSIYAGTKGAIDALTLSVARDLSRHNIRCNTINVGYFDTPLLRSASDKVVEYIASDIVLCPRRLGHPDEFAHLAQSLIENQMLNGCCIKLDGCAEPAQDRPSGTLK